jgi:hypothetical protein
MFILPSRGRPQNVERLIEHYRYTDATAPVVLYLDTDDPRLNDYALIDMPPTWTERVYSRASYNPVWHINNRHFNDFPDEPWYGHINDDMVPRTYHWDQELIATAGSDYIAYGDDMLQGKRMCTFPVIGGNLVRRFGRLMFKGLNIDSAWMLLGYKHGLLRYRPDVKLEHLHYTVNKAPFDSTYDVDEAIRNGGSCEALEAFMREWILPEQFNAEA